MKKSSGKMHHIASPGAVKKGSAPFASSWSNSRPSAKSAGLSTSPAGNNTQYRDQGKKGLFSGRRGG